MKNRLFFVFFTMLVFCQSAAGLEVSVSRTVIPEGESFDLYVRQDGDIDQPDLSVLNKDFLVVQERKSFKSTYINGKMEKFNENVISLIPRKTGEVVLPSIRAGKEKSAPRTLTVVPGGQAVPADPQDKTKTVQANVFIRSALVDKTPYVGQQVLYTVRLYAFVRTPLIGGEVIAPKVDGMAVEQWGDTKRYREQVNQRTYDVLEYNFLLFPQKSGKIDLPPAQFQGTISDPQAKEEAIDGLFDFGRVGFFTGFSGQKNVAVSSESMELNVLPKPSSAGNVWLPATNVATTEDVVPPKQTITLGEALTRTVTVMVNGVRDTQIPDLVFADGDGYKQYPGKTDAKNLFDNKGIVGVKTRQVVFLPTKAGKIILPGMEIPWFDIKTKQMKMAVLPPRTVMVEPGEGGIESVAATPAVPQEAMTDGPSVSVEKIPAQTEFAKAFSEPQPNVAEQQAADAFWSKYISQKPERLFASGLLAGAAAVTVLWLLAYLFIFRRAAKLHQEDVLQTETPRRDALRLLKHMCLNGTALQAKEALLKAGAAIWPKKPPLTLSEIAMRFDDKALSVEIEKLNQALYGEEKEAWNGKALWEAFKAAEATQKANTDQEKTPVPPLYPN